MYLVDLCGQQQKALTEKLPGMLAVNKLKAVSKPADVRRNIACLCNIDRDNQDRYELKIAFL